MGADPKEESVGEIGGEMGEDLIHLLRGLAPGRPEVEDDRSGPAERVVELLLRLHVLNAPHLLRCFFSARLLFAFLTQRGSGGGWPEESSGERRKARRKGSLVPCFWSLWLLF